VIQRIVWGCCVALSIACSNGTPREPPGAVVSAKPGGDAVKPVLIPDLDLHLPPGWNQRPNPDGPLTYSPKPDDSAGVLQVSKLPDNDYGFIAGHEKLGPFAAEVGARLGWGKAVGEKDTPCSMGRLGLATFTSKDFPAMFLFITVSGSSAHMWTWLGPSVQADEVKQALQIVVEAQESQEAK